MCSLENVCSLHSRTLRQATQRHRRDFIFMATQSKTNNSAFGQGRRHQSQDRRQAGEIRRQAGRQRREEPGPGRRRSRRRHPRRRRPPRHRPRRRAGRAVHRPLQRRAQDQGLPQRAPSHPEAHRASRHHRPPQGDDGGQEDPQPGRARGAQAPAHGRDDAEEEPHRGRAARPQGDRRADLARPGDRRAGHRPARLDPLAARLTAVPLTRAQHLTGPGIARAGRVQRPRTATGREAPGSYGQSRCAGTKARNRKRTPRLSSSLKR